MSHRSRRLFHEMLGVRSLKWPLASPPGAPAFISGQGGYDCYRIPALISLESGDLVAFAEGRKFSCSDHDWNDIVSRRSTDGGKTWSDIQVVYGASTPSNHVTIGNPAPALGLDGKTIHLPFCRNNNAVLYLSSTDGGKTWPSKPVDITSQVVPSTWSWVATGPPGSIVTSKGSILVAADHTEGGQPGSHTFQSDDGGATWKLNAILKQGNECQVAELPPPSHAGSNGSASAAGNLVLNMRSANNTQHARLIGRSSDGGHSWTVAEAKEMPDPHCEGSMVVGAASTSTTSTSSRTSSRIGPSSSGVRALPALYASNAASTSTRTNMTVYSSHDGGSSWQNLRNVFAGASAYSSLQVLGSAVPSGPRSVE